VGFDFSAAAVKVAHNKGLTAVVASGEAIPLPDRSLDALTCTYAIYYMPDLRCLLSEWARLLRPGGRIVITGPAANSNVELYRFHLEATGKRPSDADQIALGYVEEIVASQLPIANLWSEDLSVLSNPVVFPSGRFLEYWRATSLFSRTVAPTSVDGVLARGAELLQCFPNGFTVTKQVAILSARRRGG
jgi:SAM-dependent methyltransferase